MMRLQHSVPRLRRLTLGLIVLGIIAPQPAWKATFVSSSFAEEPPDFGVTAESDAAPHARFFAAATYDAKRGRIIIFGGRDPNGIDTSDHFLALDPQTMKWSKVSTAGAAPSGTGRPGLVYVDRDDALYLFGGWPAGGENPMGELWRLRLGDQDKLNWEKLTPDDPIPAARNGMVLVYDRTSHRIILHGGDSWTDPDVGFKPMADLWEYDIAKNGWRLLKPTGEVPTLRWNHAATIDQGNQKLFLLGGAGYDNGKSIRDLNLYELDLTRDTWRRLPVEGDLPTPLEGHSLTFDAKAHCLLLVGGLSLADRGPAGPTQVWTFDPATMEWSKTEGVLDRSRRGHVAIYDPTGSRHILFGGQPAVERGNFYKKGQTFDDVVVIKLERE